MPRHHQEKEQMTRAANQGGSGVKGGSPGKAPPGFSEGAEPPGKSAPKECLEHTGGGCLGWGPKGPAPWAH